MSGWYTLLKFVHVVAVVVWVGGMITLVALNRRLAREDAAAASGLLARQSQFVGQSMLGPAAIVTLLAGFGMLGVSSWGFPLWVAWGLIAIFASIALGAVFIRRAGLALAALTAAGEADAARVAAARRRLELLNLLNVLLLLSAVGAMVFKPTL